MECIDDMEKKAGPKVYNIKSKIIDIETKETIGSEFLGNLGQIVTF